MLGFRAEFGVQGFWPLLLVHKPWCVEAFRVLQVVVKRICRDEVFDIFLWVCVQRNVTILRKVEGW